MLNLVNSTMAESVNDEVFDITDKNYQKVSKNLENVNFKIFQNISFVIVLFVNDVTSFCFQSGYMEGVTDGRNSVFQDGFDNGYEDGFRMGYLLGITDKPKPSRGNCAICLDPSFMKKPIEDIREAHRKKFEEETAKASN